ncbi:MAG: hypothetical protein JWP95_1733, partial [Actinotalea sp.]|nr:hypothetical protein [Actinotalea sp.]
MGGAQDVGVVEAAEPSDSAPRPSRTHHACTIVARNYTAQARVLARSFAEHHPEETFSTLVIDGREEDRDLGGVGQVLLPTDLGVDVRTIHLMQTIYDVMEYATALKPALLMHLLRSGARSAMYFDPDIRLYGGVRDVFEEAARSGIVVTPHTVEPLPRDGRFLNEAVIMHAGIYNLGFIGAGPGGYQFLAWWHDRLTVDAVVDLTNALFTDQRWVDWAPAIATPTVLRDKSLNAAYWNVHERPVTRGQDGRWEVAGSPLRFFHFSGYDPAIPSVLSKHQGHHPRNLLSELDGLRALCQEYAAELVESGHVQMRKQPYRHDHLPDGLRLTPLVRRLCRDALLAVEPDLGTLPDPWAEPEDFRTWLLRPDLRAGPVAFSRFEHTFWRARSDLRHAFPDPLGTDAARLREWLDTAPDLAELHRQTGLGEPEPRITRTRRTNDHAQHGWSIVGYAKAELGVGEAGRRLSSAVAHTGVPWEMVGVTVGPMSRQEHTFRGVLTDDVGYDNSILCANADQTPRLSHMLGLHPARGRRIGYWFWELETFPERFHGAFGFVDEVWVASEFNRAAISAVTELPVRVVPLPVQLPTSPTRFTRAQLGLPQERTVFLANFDYLSVIKRKNPLGAIEAYRRAFGPEDGTCLVVKSINGHLRPLDREKVRMAAAGRPDIVLVDGYMSAHEMRAMAELADCVVSLHRSEGYGLNLVDAMARRTPVVATAYSGNMSVMDESTALLVPYELTEVGDDAGPYDSTAHWADPDLDAAAAALRRVVEDP